MAKAKDEIGNQYGRLVVLGRAGSTNAGKARWLCQCACGECTEIIGASLRAGTTQSCGCLQKEIVAERLRKRATHRMTKTPEYVAWASMKTRCTNIGNPNYADWGGRGITICRRWIESFEDFYADMGKRPGPHYCLDRIDNNGNYEPSNCCWVTKIKQNRNRRDTPYVDYRGRAWPLTELALAARIHPSTFRGRLERGWSVERALSQHGLEPS